MKKEKMTILTLQNRFVLSGTGENKVSLGETSDTLGETH
jgi:hypothetical protein